jgi:hypothetical protein
LVKLLEHSQQWNEQVGITGALLRQLAHDLSRRRARANGPGTGLLHPEHLNLQYNDLHTVDELLLQVIEGFMCDPGVRL